MKPDWETGARGRIYAFGRRAIPVAWRRALRRRVRTERLFGLRKPPADLAPREPEPGPPIAGRADVLFLPVIAWTYRRQRPQQLAEALARRGRRVFYGTLRGSGEPEAPAGAAPGVTLLPIPGIRREDVADRKLRDAAVETAAAGLAGWRARFGLREAALVVESPFWEPLAAALRSRFRWRIIYDCLDAHAEFSSNRPGIFAEAERRLAGSADLVVATSEPLQQRMAAWNPAARLLPNACDFALFGGIDPPAPRPGALTVGYVGAVDEWFDMELLSRAARLRPAWRFEIVGGLEDVGAEPVRLPNVTFRGERSHREIPEFLARFDVAIIPFRLTALTHATDPVKLYEAAAAGRAVVATRMQSLEPFARRGLVRLATGPEELVGQIEAAASGGAAQADRLRVFARENTWDIRAATLDSWIVNLSPHAQVT